jgi:putative RNA 2'-phosphotransferase
MKYADKNPLEQKRISKFLSLVLRHAPEKLKLHMDQNGWVAVDELIRNAGAYANIPIDPDLLARIVRTNDKQRFALSADGSKIRANQGHSIAVDLALEAAAPPDRLYHGSASRFLDSINRQGLLPMRRQHVHLSCAIETALAVGARHGKPVVFAIDAKAMYTEGFLFYLSENKVWLTAAVPVRFMTALDTAL